MDYSTDSILSNGAIIAVLAAIAAFLIFLVLFIKVYLPFKEERDYIKLEMARSFEEEEYLYWKRKLKSFYLSYIPFGKRFLK